MNPHRRAYPLSFAALTVSLGVAGVILQVVDGSIILPLGRTLLVGSFVMAGFAWTAVLARAYRVYWAHGPRIERRYAHVRIVTEGIRSTEHPTPVTEYHHEHDSLTPRWGWLQWAVWREGTDHSAMLTIHGILAGPVIGMMAGVWTGTLAGIGVSAVVGLVLTVPLLLLWYRSLNSEYDRVLHGVVAVTIPDTVPSSGTDSNWDDIVRRLTEK